MKLKTSVAEHLAPSPVKLEYQSAQQSVCLHSDRSVHQQKQQQQ